MERMNLITHPDAIFSDEKIYRFRKYVDLKNPAEFECDIFADARYKLYINGHIVAAGPCKGNCSDKYYDHIMVKEYFKNGVNIIEAVVLQLKNEFDGESVYKNLGSVQRTGALRFALKGAVKCQDRTVVQIETDETWKTAKCDYVSFVGDENFIVGLNEVVSKNTIFEDIWKDAACAGVCCEYDSTKTNIVQMGRYTLKAAPIPMRAFNLIPLSFDENGVCDAGVHTTAYLKFTFSGVGKVKLTYSECKTVLKDGKPYKADRADEKGELFGYCDEVEVNGSQLEYEPFWLRTFRFIKAEVTGSVHIDKVEGFETGYPLFVKGSFECDDEIDEKLWEISLRTLKRCMQETYTDCPYYEQLQYLMDTRLQILYTYHVSGDDTMARRTLNDFASAQLPDGMLYSRTPDILPQIIPGFALYYIFILREHYGYFADIDVVKSYLPTACGVLRYFDEHLSQKGLVKRSGFWDFVDWSPVWKETAGVPLGDENEELCVYSLMYAAALKAIAFLYKALGSHDEAQCFIIKSENVIADVRLWCYDDKKGLFADGPSKKYFSAHTQIWVVLSGAVEKNEAFEIMKKANLLDAQPTFAYTYDYFRALEMSGMYHEREKMLKILRDLVKKNCTTIPETPTEPRSECHAWGSVVLYEFAAVDLGVKIDEPTKTILIKPFLEERNWAKGTIPLKSGEVTIHWKKDNGRFSIEILSKKEYLKRVTMPDGKVYESAKDKIELFCDMK